MTTLRRAHRRWTDAEREFLAAHVDTMTNEQIGAALGRSAKSVEGLCWLTGIKRTPAGRQRLAREAGPRISAGKRHRTNHNIGAQNAPEAVQC